MKNIFQNILKTTIICLLLVLSSCEKDLYDEAIIQQSRATSEKISINQVLSEINSPLIKEYINNELRQELNFSQSKSSEDYFTFMKIIKQDSYTTYSLLLNVYTAEKPYFKFFIITKEGITEKAGYFKYTPDNNEPIFNAEDLNGKVQVLDVENNVKGETIFISSQPQSPPIGTDMIDCVDTYDVITHNCTNGDNHPPGVPCNNGNVNDGYYEVVVITTCTSTSDYYHIAPPIDFMGASTIVGGGDMLSINLNVLQYIFSLNDEQYSILQQCPSLVTYLENNDSSPESNNLVTWAINSILFNINTNDFINEAFNSLNNNNEVDFENRVIIDATFRNNPCLNGVYTQLGSAPSFQNYLQNFDGNFSVANLQLSVGVSALYPTANAVTTEPQNYLIKIMFNPNNLSRPQLDVARTFIHELIHAEIYRKLLSIAGQPNIPWTREFINSIKNDYPGLYDYYIRYIYNVPQGQQPSSAQHQLMAQHYRQVIIEVMQQFDNTQTPDVYEALSWIGLMGEGTINSTTGLATNSTIAWQNLSQSQRLQIISTWNTYVNSNPPCQP